MSGTASDRRRQPVASGMQAARSANDSRSTSASVCNSRGDGACASRPIRGDGVQPRVEHPAELRGQSFEGPRSSAVSDTESMNVIMYELPVSSRQLVTGNWQLATGNWQLATDH